jgi:hypothetical protein
MHLHFVLEYSCELKANGDVAFLRGVTPYAMWRDLEQHVASFGDHRSAKSREGNPLSINAAWDDEAQMGEEELTRQLVTLPRFARRDKDPDNGRISAAALLARANKVVEKGKICRHCPAAAVNPERFGCWVGMVLPADRMLVEWLMARWRRACDGAGRSEAAMLTRLHGKRGGAYRLLLQPSERELEARRRREAEFVAGGRRETLSVDALLSFLIEVRSLGTHHQLALLHDFGAMAREDWERLRDYRADQPTAGVPWEAAPFIAQPLADDSPSVHSFIALLHLCYWAIHLGRGITVQPVTIHEAVGRSAA